MTFSQPNLSKLIWLNCFVVCVTFPSISTYCLPFFLFRNYSILWGIHLQATGFQQTIPETNPTCDYLGIETLHGRATLECGLQRHHVINLVWAVAVLRRTGGSEPVVPNRTSCSETNHWFQEEPVVPRETSGSKKSQTSGSEPGFCEEPVVPSKWFGEEQSCSEMNHWFQEEPVDPKETSGFQEEPVVLIQWFQEEPDQWFWASGSEENQWFRENPVVSKKSQ